MSLSDVIRNIAKTVTNKDELKEKAKDLPLLVVQTTLSAAGQALLLVDRMKNSIKGIGSKEEREEKEYDSRPTAAEQVAAAPAEAEEDKPGRKEPVIFAPRPGTAEPNGVAKTKPDPVIFTPAAKPETSEKAETVVVAEPDLAPQAEAATKTETAPKPVAEPAAEPVAEPKAAEPIVEPAPEPEPVVKPVVKPVAEPKATKPRATRATKAKAAAPKAAEPTVAPEPQAAPEPTPAPEPTLAAEPVTSAAVDLLEPLPGYSELTVASLRARMRGKTADQISDFLVFERANAARPEVIRMFENRLAKLQAGE
ncbi:hypothetical protein [Nonomuraea sp. NPDC050643]|uniref:hypothetical protein n=1 Tax=Nonomuraea sp. NPDC050643 TaxID=3155660 RepID=UPI0033F26E1C